MCHEDTSATSGGDAQPFQTGEDSSPMTVASASSDTSQLGPKPGWHRRTFLQAAALGTAAAALLSKNAGGGLSFGAQVASAGNCNAGDIDVLQGTILNEPC